MELKFLYINDVHSRFEELAKIASAIEELCDENTLILDAGDNADFARLETKGTNGIISSALLNKIDFTARIFGNTEGFAGKENGRIIIYPIVSNSFGYFSLARASTLPRCTQPSGPQLFTYLRFSFANYNFGNSNNIVARKETWRKKID